MSYRQREKNSKKSSEQMKPFSKKGKKYSDGRICTNLSTVFGENFKIMNYEMPKMIDFPPLLDNN